MSVCPRCGEDTQVISMSIFNIEMICSDCQNKEKKHEKYEEARYAEREAIKSGNYNFPGIGKPSDL